MSQSTELTENLLLMEGGYPHLPKPSKPAPPMPVIEEPNRAPYGIIDPEYARAYTIIRKLAWEEGYAIGLHGSFTRDLDLIAVPWTDHAREPERLVRRICASVLKLREQQGNPGIKPHGRKAWTLLFPEFGDPRFIDLSIMPLPPAIETVKQEKKLKEIGEVRHFAQPYPNLEPAHIEVFFNGPPPSHGTKVYAMQSVEAKP